MMPFERSAQQGTDAITRNYRKDAPCETFQAHPLDHTDENPHSLWDSPQKTNPKCVPTNKQHQPRVLKTVRENRTSFIPMGDLDIVRRKLVFDNMPLHEEEAVPAATSQAAKTRNSGISGADFNGIRKFR